jgi:hypothetical protein
MNNLLKETGNAGRTFFIFFLLLIAVKSNVSAQTAKFGFGIRAGLNLSTALVNDAVAIKFKPGYHIGGTVDYFFTQKFGLQSGLFFSVKGSKIVGFNSGDYVGGSPEDYAYTFNELYLRLPLYITFRKSISGKFNVNIGFGSYFAYGIAGKTKRTFFPNRSTEIEWRTFGNGVYDEARDWLRGETLNPFDFGAGVKVDFGYNKFIWGIGLEAGILDVMNKKESRDLHYRNENISVSVGYRF